MKDIIIALIVGTVMYLFMTLFLIHIYDKSAQNFIICYFSIGYLLSTLFFVIIPLIKLKKQKKS